jgi:hypothetical protein
MARKKGERGQVQVQGQEQGKPALFPVGDKAKLFGSIEERRVFTNLTDSRLIISDLGVKPGPQGMIAESEVFDPRQSRDLGQYYTDAQLLTSKALRHFIEEKKLMEGRPAADFKPPVTDTQKVRERGKDVNEFQDPSRNPYDEALTKLKDKEATEDNETKVGMGGV